MVRPELLYEIKLVDSDDNCVVYNGGAEYFNLTDDKYAEGNPVLTSDTD